MRQSQSLIKALEAAAEALTSESCDLKELAAKAAATSGIPANSILMNIDLTEIDLTGKQIDYLTDKGAHYHAAHLTSEQRAKFRRGERELRTRQTRRKIQSIRIEMIADFVDAFEAQDVSIVDRERKRHLNAQQLKEILLSRVGADYTANKPLDEKYTQHVLRGLVPFAVSTNLEFFKDVFNLLGRLKCETGEVVRAFIMGHYYSEFGDTVGDLIAQLLPNAALDSQWIKVNSMEMAWINSGRGKKGDSRDVFPSPFVDRARQINKYRAIHPGAIEDVLDFIQDGLQRLSFIEKIEFDCSADEAERIAIRIVKADWPASLTRRVLEAEVPTRVRSALFRQIMHQGSVERTLELLRWLNNNRGAVGALSLDDALTRINSFTALFDFATDVHMDLAVNQLNVLRQALNRTAKDSAQRSKVRRLLPE